MLMGGSSNFDDAAMRSHRSPVLFKKKRTKNMQGFSGGSEYNINRRDRHWPTNSMENPTLRNVVLGQGRH
jgi:hypothetical protein